MEAVVAWFEYPRILKKGPRKMKRSVGLNETRSREPQNTRALYQLQRYRHFTRTSYCIGPTGATFSITKIRTPPNPRHSYLSHAGMILPFYFEVYRSWLRDSASGLVVRNFLLYLHVCGRTFQPRHMSGRFVGHNKWIWHMSMILCKKWLVTPLPRKHVLSFRQ